MSPEKWQTFGLKPAGTSGFLQPVMFETRQLVEEESSITIVREGGEVVLDRLDATQSSRADLAPMTNAAMVFVGYGLRVPEARYDDLAGVDLRGKVAVYVNGTGALDAPGPVKSHVGSAPERWAALKAAGAIGSASLTNPRAPAGRWPRGATPRMHPGRAGAQAAVGAVPRRRSCWRIPSYRNRPSRESPSRSHAEGAISFSREAATPRKRS